MTKQGAGQEQRTTEFDPSSVPPYPVITLTGADDPDNVTVDQQKFEGEDAYDRALQTCVARAAELGGAVRVRGVAKDGTEWPLVVTADGELHELTPSSTTQDRARLSRRRLLVGGGLLASMLVVGGGSVGGVIAWRNAQKPEPPPPPPKFPGKGANLPVVPPDGVDTQAQWAVVINDGTERAVQLLPNGQLALPSSDGRLVLVDAVTGQLQWAGGMPSRIGSLDILELEDATMLANYTQSGIDMWDLADPDAPAAHHVELNHQTSTPLTLGDGALFALGSQTAQFLVGRELVLVDIPVPAVPAGVREQKAIAVDHTGWLEIDEANTPTHTALADLPAGARIEDARVLGTEVLASRWETPQGSVLTAHTLPNGALIGEVPVSGNGQPPLASPSGVAWVWEETLITAADVSSLERYTDEGASEFSAHVITDTEVWGQVGEVPARLPLDTRQLQMDDPDAHLPVATLDNSLAFIVATKLEDTILHALAMDLPSPAPSDEGGD